MSPALSARIARGEYRDFEGDSFRNRDGKVQHRAWGLWQAHRNRLNDAAWGSPDIGVQTQEAARALRRAFYTCNGGSHPRADWVRSTLTSYSGRNCDATCPVSTNAWRHTSASCTRCNPGRARSWSTESCRRGCVERFERRFLRT